MKNGKPVLSEPDRAMVNSLVEDEKRLINAAFKAGVTYMGCDTPDLLAETIVELRDDVLRLQGKVVAHENELRARHLRAMRLNTENKKTRTCLADVLTWMTNSGYVGGVHFDEQSIVDSIRDVLWVGARCNRCHRPMRGTTPSDGACACGGLIANATDGRK